MRNDKNIGNNRNTDDNKNPALFTMFLSFFASSPISPNLFTPNLTLLGLKTGTASDKIFFNEENQKDLISAFEKTK